MEVTYNGKTISLTKTEGKIYSILLERAGKVVGREEIIQALYGRDLDSRVVDVYIGYLKAKLGKKSIETVRKYGYSLQVGKIS